MSPWNSEEVTRQDVFDHFAHVIKATAHGRRLELLEILAQGEHTVDTLSQLSGLAVTTASNNLQTLKRAGLVSTRREGTSIFYRLAGADVLELFLAAKRVALRRYPALANALQTYMGDPRSHGPTIDPAEITADMYILDVRPQAEYKSGHFPAAVCIPMAELEERHGEVPRDRQVVVYCRGELCRLAREAAALLRDRGVDARAMDEGVTEWRAAKDFPLDHAS